LEKKVIKIGKQKIELTKLMCNGPCKQYYWTKRVVENYFCERCSFELKCNAFNFQKVYTPIIPYYGKPE
jgi:hypothetical protein